MKRGRKNIRVLRRSARHSRMSINVTLQQYRGVISYCAAYVDAFIKPCFQMRTRRKMAARRRSIMAVVLHRIWQSRALRVDALRAHIRALHVRHEQSLFWLHSANPYAP